MPQVAEKQELPACWTLFNAAVRHSKAPLILWGPAGIGKTYGILAAARATGTACFKVQVTEETSAEEPRGRFAPVPVREEGRVVGTCLEWQDGPLLQAVRGGGWVLWDDMHRIGPDVLGLLYLAAESRESLTLALPTGEVIEAPAGRYRCLATSNVPPDETLDEALLSRFALRIHINAPHPDALAPFPRAWREAIAQSVSLEDPKRRTSLREWYTFTELAQSMGSMEAPAALVWGARGGDVVNAVKIGTAGV